jgi:EH domain-containing protein 1
MLDSITERDRGYNYQDVIGDLAQIADLVLVLFDPHKAGTVREAHTSLRDTLPAKTFEDRVFTFSTASTNAPP